MQTHSPQRNIQQPYTTYVSRIKHTTLYPTQAKNRCLYDIQRPEATTMVQNDVQEIRLADTPINNIWYVVRCNRFTLLRLGRYKMYENAQNISQVSYLNYARYMREDQRAQERHIRHPRDKSRLY